MRGILNWRAARSLMFQLHLTGCLVPALCLGAAVANAQPAANSQQLPGTAPSSQQNPVPGPGSTNAASGAAPAPGEPGFTTGLFSSSRSNLLGDIYGVRSFLGQYGISLGLQE